MEKNRKKAILLLSFYFLAFSQLSSEKRSQDNITYNYEQNANFFARLNNHNVVFLSVLEFEKIIPNDNDIYVIDSLNDDMSFAIYNSYRITNNKDQSDLIDIIFSYTKSINYNWKRTKESILNEWDVHNICYKFNILTERSKTVDLEENEENRYSSKILSIILGNNNY